MRYKIIFAIKANEDITRIAKSGDRKLLKKLYLLLEELESHPTTGTGRPELLKHFKTPTWSRRISGKHRLIYRIEKKVITVLVLSAWGHYGDK